MTGDRALTVGTHRPVNPTFHVNKGAIGFMRGTAFVRMASPSKVKSAARLVELAPVGWVVWRHFGLDGAVRASLVDDSVASDDFDLADDRVTLNCPVVSVDGPMVVSAEQHEVVEI
jgi:hypothetical protein